jgi:superfamily II DNA or RNA helicase
MTEIIASNKITIRKAPLQMLESIKRKLTIPNPLYWKKKRMGLWVSPKDQFYTYFSQPDPDTLVVPRGLLGRIRKFFPDVKVEEDFISLQLTSKFAPVELRDYQKAIMSHFIAEKPTEGIFSLSVGSGKTIIAMEIIRNLGLTGTVLVNTSVIQDQFTEEMKKHWGYEPGIINGKEKTIKEVTVANIASLYDNPELLKQLIDNTSILIYDECHTALSDKRTEVVEQFKPKHIFGLSGTVAREDGQGPAIPFYFGNVIEEYEATMICPTVEVVDPREFIPVCVNYHEMIDKMVENDSRNTLIAGLAAGEALQGRKVLVLTKRVEHYQNIRAKLPGGDTILMAESDDGELGFKLQQLRENKMDFSIILGTFSLLSTGFSIEKLDVLIIAGDLKSEVLTMQSSGRVLRLLKDKTAKIIDIFDSQNGIFRRQHLARRKLYEKKGWKIITKWDK